MISNDIYMWQLLWVLTDEGRVHKKIHPQIGDIGSVCKGKSIED